MKRFLLIVISLILFIFAYQIRSGFLKNNDYNEPSDGHEYLISTSQGTKAIKDIISLSDLKNMLPQFIVSMDTHSAPSYMFYSILNQFIFKENRLIVNAIASSLFVSVLFLISVRLFPLWIALLISSIALFYTPLFTFIYSYMPESFGGFFVPTLSVTTVFFALKSFRSRILAILTGVILGMIALYRIELRWAGIPFTILWFLSYPKKKNLISAFLMFLFYLSIVLGWMYIANFFNNPYYTESNVFGVLYNAYNWKYSGWQFDTASIRGWGLFDLLGFILSQGPFKLFWLQTAQVIRLWAKPAAAYIGEYLISDSLLLPMHLLLIGFAILGLRRIFFDRKFLFLSIFLIWGSVFSYVPEELRRQIPLSGIMLIFAGAGIYELSILLRKGERLLLTLLLLVFLLHSVDPQLIYGYILLFLPFFSNIFPIRILLILFEGVALVAIAKKYCAIDIKNKFLFLNSNKAVKIIPSLIPLIAGLTLIAYQLRSPYWHQFSTLLLPNTRIEQSIIISSEARSNFLKEEGFVLVDIQGPEGDKNIKVSLNGKVLKERLSLRKSMSPVDLLVHRQFQRKMPRLGWGKIEESVASSSAFPNMHQWLIFPISKNLLLEKNLIVVENTLSLKGKSPLIFGDYPSSFGKNIYDGPTARIFQGGGSFYKFQVEGDRRLVEAVSLESQSNKSNFYINGKKNDDLSLAVGRQKGRYRIFFLFPYRGFDPESVF